MFHFVLWQTHTTCTKYHAQAFDATERCKRVRSGSQSGAARVAGFCENIDTLSYPVQHSLIGLVCVERRGFRFKLNFVISISITIQLHFIG